MKTIGFVGIGIMGKGMLKNLATKLNIPLVIWNRSPTVCEEIKNDYGDLITIASTAADVVKSSDITYCMLSTEEASKAVFDEPETGVIAGVSEGKAIVDCATLSRERMQETEQKVLAKGGKFLEAPVSGSKGPAESGTLIFLCGGDKDLYEIASPGFDAMGKAKFLFGPVGKGSEVKLIVNMIMGTMMSAFAEGLALGEANEIDPSQLLEVLDLGAMSNPMFRLKGPLMSDKKYPTNFPLKHQQKDMRLALALSEQVGLDLSTSAAANEEYKKAMNAPHNSADDDFCAIIKAVRKEN